MHLITSKKLIVALLMILGLKIHSQDKRFVVFQQFETLQLYDKIRLNTFNLGYGIEYQMTYFFFKAQFLSDFKRDGIDYLDMEGVVGVNVHSRFEDWRYYLGAKLGAIYREGWGHEKTGIEGGIERYFDGWYIGSYIKWDYNTDGRVFIFQPSDYSRISLGFKTGIRL